MAIPLSSKANTVVPGGNYPYGDVKDNTGGNNGTNVNRNLVGDLIQFFERLMAVGGVVANGLPENLANGWQYLTALGNIIAAQVAAEAAIRSAADTTLTNTKVAKAGDSMTGALAMGANKITGLGTPTTGTDATTKTYVDSGDSTEASTRSAADTTLQNNINGKLAVGNVAPDNSTVEVSAGVLRIKAGGAALNLGYTPVDFPTGIWNMDTTASITISMGALDANKVRGISLIVVRNDAVRVGFESGGDYIFDGTNMTLSRRAAGIFDDPQFNNTIIDPKVICTLWMIP